MTISNLLEAIPFSPSRLDATYFISKRVKNQLKNDQQIIDIGSGGYYLVSLLSLLDVNFGYLGVDTNPKKFDIKTKNIKVNVVKKDILQFNTSKKFDVATCLWTLEHIKNDEKALEKIFKLLKKNGMLIITVPSIWSWPIEFGRHGYRYYTRSQIIKLVQSADFKIVEFYEAGGFLGLLFMLIYSWPRYLVLIPLSTIYLVLKFSGLVQNSWKKFSHKVVSSLFYFYHRSQKGVLVHNLVVSRIVSFDNKFKIFPTSYVLVVRK